MSDDYLTALIGDARPATPADNGWAFSPAGQELHARIHRAITSDQATVGAGVRRRRRRILAAVALSAAAAASVAFTVAVTRPAADPGAVMCNEEASLTSDGAGIPVPDATPQAAIAACSTRWAQLWPNTPRPAAFAVCVYPATRGNDGGGQVVIPTDGLTANDTACSAAGFALLDSATR